MNVEDHLETIKTGLLSLKAAGADGFEGLLRLVLTNLTSIPFRLAASGLQGGMDGDAAFSGDPICFEAKRYSDNTISRSDVLTKIADLSRRSNAADRLWILGATIEISTQLAQNIRDDGDKNAISTLILDWTASPLPLLAVAVVAGGTAAARFIAEKHDEKSEKSQLSEVDLSAAFSSISGHPDFESLLHRLKSDFNVSKMSFKRAVDRNAAWRKETFGSTRLAKERLEQGLAVLEDQAFPPMRVDLRKSITKELEARNEVILLGDEGHGKSWLAAQFCADASGLALFISAEQFDNVSVPDLDDFLIDQIIRQTGEIIDDTLKFRWRHRLEAWRTEPPIASLLVVVDGLNQRQKFRWDRLLNSIQLRLARINGKLIVTVRPQFWRTTIARGLEFNPKTFEIPEWSPEERNAILKHYGISLNWLDPKTLKTLQNPRLLSIAVATLPNRDAVAWKGLTTDRLLMEHLRASQRENYEGEKFKDLCSRLSEHAAKVIERLKTCTEEPFQRQNFRADCTAVIETRFFRPLPGPGDYYELREEGLTLALGFALLDQLWNARRATPDLSNQITQLIEPIRAMDRTTDVVFAALLICALDDSRFDSVVFSALLDAFANLQNVSDQRFEEFVEIVKHQPEVLFDTLKQICLDKGQRINLDWFIHAAAIVSSTEKGWCAAKSAIHRWFRCYNKDPVAQASRYRRQSDPDFEDHVRKRKEETNEELKNLSLFEMQLLNDMIGVQAELDDLFVLGLKLLARRSLKEFAEDFIAMGLAFGLDRDMHAATKAFQQLTTFNRVDRAETRSAFLKAIEPLRTKDTSRVGQWTVVRMLNATGNEGDAAEAALLAEELRKDWDRFEPPPSSGWRQINVANPDVIRPSNMDQGLLQFVGLDVERMRQSMGSSIEDRNFGDFLPVAARFKPEAAIEKTRQVLARLLTRTDHPFRQVILNSEDHLPLVDPDLAANLIKRMQETNPVEALPEQEQTICRMLAFYYAASQISADEQLKCMTGKAFGPNYILSVIPSLKLQPTGEITSRIRNALQAFDEDAAHGALAAALHGQTPISDELEELIVICLRGASSRLRAIACELGIRKSLTRVRQAHVRSGWNAALVDDDTFEAWFGSILLIEACAHGELPVDDLLKRISHQTWFAAAERLGKAFAEAIVESLVERLRRAVSAACGIQRPAVDFRLSKSGATSCIRLSIEEAGRYGERFPKQQSLKELAGTDDDFYEKQSLLNSAAKNFFKELKDSDARLLVQSVTIEDLRSIFGEVSEPLIDLVDLLQQASNTAFVWLKNLAFAVANIISRESPESAVALMKRALSSQSFVTVVIGDDLTLEHQAIWGAEASEPLKKLWRQRLLGSENDAVLAREVLAAERFGAANFIKDFILHLAASEDSLDQAYALLMAGYSIRSGDHADLFSNHIGRKGVPGQAAKHALSEHENALWARHWVEKMWEAPTPEEFWRCLIIAKTTMDARVSPEPPENSDWGHYAPVFRRAREAALKERNKVREKRLVGQDVPERVFVSFAD